LRRRAREIAARAGLDAIGQSQLAAAAAEVARIPGTAQFLLDEERRILTIRISSNTRPASRSSVAGLVSEFRVHGSMVSLSKRLPAAATLSERKLTRTASHRPLDQFREDNREVLALLKALREREDALAMLDTERDEKSERLRRFEQMRSRFLSRLSDEFRTPLTSILALSRLLADETDGPLSEEQHKQVAFIRKCAENLLEIGSGLLEIVRAETEVPVGKPSEPPLPGSGCDLLVIDDEEVSRYLIRQAVGRTMTLAEAADGPSGIEAARKLTPRAILLAVDMPGMSGLDVIEVLKSDPATRPIPIMLMTVKPLASAEMKRVKPHCAAILSKEIFSEPDATGRLAAAVEGKAVTGRSVRVARARS
jgi:CheY-like chemotaxis protein